MQEGSEVIDGEDPEPNRGVVVWRPEGRTISDWEYEADGETYTTAEANPEYPDDEQLVVITFRNYLEGQWPDWEEASPSELYEGVSERNIPCYGFPESRLEPAPASESEADTADDVDDVDDDDRSESTDPTARSSGADSEGESGDEQGKPEGFETLEQRLSENDFEVSYDASAEVLRAAKYGDEYVIAPDGTVSGDGGIQGRVEMLASRLL